MSDCICVCVCLCLFNQIMSQVATRIFSTDYYPLTIEIIDDIQTVMYTTICMRRRTLFVIILRDFFFFVWLILSNDSMESFSPQRVTFYRPIENFGYAEVQGMRTIKQSSLLFNGTHTHTDAEKMGSKTNRADKLTNQIPKSNTSTSSAIMPFYTKSDGKDANVS